MKVLIACIVFITTFIDPFKVNSQTIDTLVDVGGHQLHFNIIKGTGIPILFESGGGNDATVWSDVVKRLHDATDATLITYDRAGMGKSTIDTSNITILSEVKGLENGLKKLGYTNNIFLVAHSFGGAYATLFSSRNKNKIRGAVLLDITLPCFMTSEKAKELNKPYEKELPAFKKKAIGTYYLLVNYEKSIRLLSKTPFPANIPATVIGSDIPQFKGRDSVLWKSCQKTFGELPNHRYILAKKSGHDIYSDNPELVTTEIIKLHKQVSVQKKLE